MTEDEKLELLKLLLLDKEKAQALLLIDRIDAVEQILSKKENLQKKVGPIIEEELESFTKSMPNQMGPIITKTLKVQIAESKDQVVEALFPIIGQMIKKYIAHEMKILAENIEAKTKNTFSFLNLKRKVKSAFTGVDESEIIISELAQAQIDQVFVVNMDSGILLGSYVKKQAMDEDMITGMLTAIKGFVEDAFNERNQRLNSIKYDLYEIHLYNSHSYYIASAVNGTLTEKLEKEIDDLALFISSRINKLDILNNKALLDQELESIYSRNQLEN